MDDVVGKRNGIMTDRRIADRGVAGGQAPSMTNANQPPTTDSASDSKQTKPLPPAGQVRLRHRTCGSTSPCRASSRLASFRDTPDQGTTAMIPERYRGESVRAACARNPPPSPAQRAE